MKIKKHIVPLVAAGLIACQGFILSAGQYRFYWQSSDEDEYFDDEEEEYVVAEIDSATFSKWTSDSLKHYADSLLATLKTDSIPDEYFYTVANDTVQHHYDSVLLVQVKNDSIERAKIEFQHWFDSLPKKQQKIWIKENITLPEMRHRSDSIMARKDSIKHYKDSVLEATPRILETPFIPDSLWYKRLILMNVDKKFGDIKIQKQDTSYNYYFNDYPFLRKDVNATWTGVAGGAVQTYDFHKREEEENAIFFTPYTTWTYTPNSLPAYNTKTPYTELAYYGTLFAGDRKEEINVRLLTTQNITPAANITFELNKYGGAGFMANSKTTNHSMALSGNYLGKKYSMHCGWIHSKIIQYENGGFQDNAWIRDTIVDSREIPVNLTDAQSNIKKTTLFLTQDFRIPFGNDSLTTAFIGHSLDYSTYDRWYNDKISDATGRAYYDNTFYLSSNSSDDELRTMKFDNKFFLRLQPWKDNSIVSKIDVGIGDKLLDYIDCYKDTVNTWKEKVWENNVYAYAGARGMFQQYFSWNADAAFYFVGRQAGDFNVNADIRFNTYPFRKARKSPLSVGANFHTDLTTPDHYEQRLLVNHFKWDNNFGRSNTTKIGAFLDIPYWKLRLEVDYSLLTNKIYYGADRCVAQNPETMNVLSVILNKDFTFWNFLHLDNRFLVQYTSNPDVVPLPVFSMNLRWYFQFNVVKQVMQMQIGANCLYNTEWNMPGYNPNVGVFYNQQADTYGNCPYIDVFLNIQWKRACIFIKCENVNEGWPRDYGKDYFSAHNYIHTQRVLKLGITWPFYILPKEKHSHSHESGSKKNH